MVVNKIVCDACCEEMDDRTSNDLRWGERAAWLELDGADTLDLCPACCARIQALLDEMTK